ncbi:MAG: dienelactone hydrolase family protein [Hyphomicrobiales bacterium]
MTQTDSYEGMIAETTTIAGANGDRIHAYFARPVGPGPFPSVVLLHHMPGWDEWYKEATRKFAYHGYLALAPDLYCRDGHGSPDDVAAKVRANGGIPDAQVVEDARGAMDFLRSLPQSNGKVGVMGTCSGGRHAYLAGCQVDGFDAVADLWGGGVVMQPGDLTEKRPVSPLDYTERLKAPLLGLFGEEDRAPTPEQVAVHEQELKRLGKEYEFHMYPGAGHGFFYHDRPGAYRAEAAVDGWKKLFAFFERTLGN